MSDLLSHTNEQKAGSAFTKQSVVFDQVYAGNSIIQYKRDRVRGHVQQYLPAGSSILELNSGTGEDAVWFARQGYRVNATDISAGMQHALQKKVQSNFLSASVTSELCSYTQLSDLKNTGPYDLILSNFAGLNCTNQLQQVLQSFSGLLTGNGLVTLVILPKFCLWEFLLIFRGKFKTAFRRLFSKNGVDARVEGEHFKCWYYNPSDIKKHLSRDFDVLKIEGLCTLVPPSYIENFAEKHGRLYQWLKAKEDRYKSSWPWRSIGDYYIITLQKKAKKNQEE